MSQSPYPETNQNPWSESGSKSSSPNQPLLGQSGSDESIQGASQSPEGLGEGQVFEQRHWTMTEVVKDGNLSSRAWGVQALSLLFMALTWSLILSKFPLSNLPLFGYHPLMQSLALVLLVQSILVLQPTSTPSAKKSALNVHQILNLGLSLPIFTAGATIMWYLHDQPGTKHFISWHGTVGTVVVVWSWFQVLVGAASVWFDGKLLGGGAKAKAVWKWHRLSGYVLLPLFFLTAILGITETIWAKGNSSLLLRGAVAASLVGALVLLLLRVRTSKLPKLR
ncbi:hypothetical protein IE53DRAFT_388180 [Violaceomyces palustris]|uniref:Uncharacterized protein n=1 Tax=Violaceomyces palustris TaxID=1673888 RepID=A0ACD0NUS2_9BASI|nr:hypothetical protein IE53DRAFT_388180 [Violaceomyces palustris]